MSVVSSGQTEIVSSGQIISDTTVLFGGTLLVSSGGVTVGAVISSGGTGNR